MSLAIFHVNAFTDKAFHGNPAAVCPLENWLDDKTLQGVAAECNLSETAFFVREGDLFQLRWFTPTCEVNLCGHATLASAFVLFTILQPQLPWVTFSTRGGLLTVRREGDRMAMDFPALPPWVCTNPPKDLLDGLGRAIQPQTVLQVKDNYFVVYETENQVRAIRPNLLLLEHLHPFGVAITAPGNQDDFVSRYFAPSYGITEDPVTGSTHCSLAPYWAERLGKIYLTARQVSERGGELDCQIAGARVILKGNAVLTLRGELLIP